MPAPPAFSRTWLPCSRICQNAGRAPGGRKEQTDEQKTLDCKPGRLVLRLPGHEQYRSGAVGGGLFGGALGTIVGLATHHPLAGAAIGAAAGAGTGALIGNSEDRAQVRAATAAQQQAAAIAAANPPMTVYDVAKMSQQHISDSIIIQQMRYTNSVYSLSPDDITWLKQQGVSDMVVMEMQSRRALMAPPGQPVYVGPPPPVVGLGVGVGGRW